MGVAVGVLGLGSGATTAQTRGAAATPPIENGPAADYPMVIGDPYVVDGITYTPVDTLNYDHVGYATLDESGASGVTGAHRILPLPSYVEVTALDTGRTILVRLERRGPMRGDRLIALSGAAMAQLGAGEGAAIRMRRVNPPEAHRAELRAGREAPPRMDTPGGLLEVLRRRLPEQGAAALGDPRQATISGTVPTPDAIATLDPNEQAAASPEMEDTEKGDPATIAKDEPARPELTMAVEGGPARAPVMVPISPDGNYVVQLGAFSVRANAEKMARQVQGSIVTSDRLAVVRVGPFASRGQAEQALAKLRGRGYKEALILSLE
ncbi:SPOR domain-containing protein [Qipengyuania qiaonensis]|uniref:SPOR domain-containing protein n=1 Tax=Qipengyuania qiaonensis TaxID=2867240 RepID=UPI0031F1043D